MSAETPGCESNSEARKRLAEATTPADHWTHIPAVVLDLLASDAVREAVAQTLINEGAAPGNSIHSWRCEYPDQYGPCNCVRAVADAALAALVETMRGES